MLPSNAHVRSFRLDDLWVVRRRLAAEAAAALLRASTAGGTVPVDAGRVRMVSVAVQTPVSLLQLAGTAAVSPQRWDGVDVARGDRVLLTAQADAHENGVWTLGAGLNPDPADAPFVGMLVRAQRGAVAAGWLFCCTGVGSDGAVALRPVLGPVPTKPQLDALRLDAATLESHPVDQCLNQTLESVTAAGALSLVWQGAPTPASRPLQLRGLRAGTGITLAAEADGAMLVTASSSSGSGGTVVLGGVLRPADVVAATGQFVVAPEGPTVNPLSAAAGWTALGWPAACYQSAAAAPHSGDLVGVLHVLPRMPDTWSATCTLDVALSCALTVGLAAAYPFDVVLAHTGLDPGQTTAHTGTLTVPAAATAFVANVVWAGGATVTWGPPWCFSKLVGLRLSSTSAPFAGPLLVLAVHVTLTPQP